MSTYRSLYLISLVLCSAPLWSTGCEKSPGCTVNSDCGTDALCRDTVCRPKCQTYITCAEGEACGQWGRPAGTAVSTAEALTEEPRYGQEHARAPNSTHAMGGTLKVYDLRSDQYFT